MSANRQDIFFDSDGVKLHGWLYRPSGPADQRHPMIVLSHGFSAVMALDLGDYAQAFVAAGFACLAYDHRNWGQSGGSPRFETNPWTQMEDMRAAISFVRTLGFVDPDRIGLWGTSYAGGHVLTIGALDKRVRCLVAQVPLVSGQRTFDSWVPESSRARFLQRLADDRDARARGASPGLTQAALPGSETEEWAKTVDKDGVYPNAITLRSLEMMRSYEPISFIERIAPTPLLMIVADHDTQTPVQWQREAFALAGQPKRLVSLPGRHYDPYMGLKREATEAALDWFQTHLSPPAEAAAVQDPNAAAQPKA